MINENKKNVQLIRNDISSLYNKLSRKFDELNINNNIINKEIKYDTGRYVGQVLNGLREGNGIYYFNNGNRYEGDWRNDKKEGKGIIYYNNGDRMMGDYSNDNPIGKYVMLTKYGEVKTFNY